jgi:hypothetical protein
VSDVPAGQRAIALVVAAAIHVLLVVALAWRPATREPVEPPAPATPPLPRADAPATEAPPTASAPPATDSSARAAHASAARRPSPAERADAWIARLDASRRHQRIEQFGAEIAALMDAPLGTAWHALVGRAKAGDARATAALLMLHTPCSTADAVTAAPPLSPTFDAAAGANFVAPDDRAWLGAAFHALDARTRDQAAECRASGIGPDAFRQALADLDDPFARWLAQMRPDQPTLPPVPPELLDAGGLLADETAEVLTKAGDAAVQQQALAYLESRAAQSREAASAVAACYLTETCGVRRDAPAAPAALERAAAWGDTAAIGALAEAAQAAGDPATAWAWHAYAIALEERGCARGVVDNAPSASFLIGMRNRLAQSERALTAEQLRAAQARLAELEARHGARTRAALGCGP